jgi:arabinogalactan endo-1,4-beta-galactosidase
MKHTSFALAARVDFARRADVGRVSEMAASGRIFRNRDGKPEDLHAIMDAFLER